MMKYTQGKWEPIYQHYKKEPKRICLGVGVNIEVASGTYSEIICNTILPGSDKEYIKQREEIEANMKLIAAAPDMLEALLEISEGKGRYNENQLIHASNAIEDMKQLAKDAIKKATE